MCTMGLKMLFRPHKAGYIVNLKKTTVHIMCVCVGLWQVPGNLLIP